MRRVITTTYNYKEPNQGSIQIHYLKKLNIKFAGEIIIKYYKLENLSN